METQKRLQDRMYDSYKKIAEHKKSRDDIKRRLEQVNNQGEQRNQHGIMEGSILTVHVVEARDLKPLDYDQTSDPYVILMIEGQKITSNFKKATINPVWNESFTFDIDHGREKLRIEIYDKDTFGSDEFEGMCFVDLQEDLNDQMKHDLWIDLIDKEGNPASGRIRLMLQWVYSKVQYFTNYLDKWDETLRRDIEEHEQIDKYLKQLESPFGFLDTMKMEAIEDSDDEEDGAAPKTKAEIIFREQEKQYRHKEMELVQNIDNIGMNIASKLGFQNVPWFTLTKILLWIYTVLTIFVMFFRPDFVNLTVCIIGIYMLHNTERIKRITFRLLVLLIFVSLIYDIMYFMIGNQSGDQPYDGGIEKGIRNFSSTMSYISFFFRVSFDFNCARSSWHWSSGKIRLTSRESLRRSPTT